MRPLRKLRQWLRTLSTSTPARCSICDKLHTKSKDARMCEEKKPDEIVKIGHGVVFTVATTFGTSTINTTELQGVVYGVWVTESDHKFLGYKIQTSDGALYKIPGDRVRFQKKVA